MSQQPEPGPLSFPVVADLLAAVEAYAASRKGPWADDDFAALERAAARVMGAK